MKALRLLATACCLSLFASLSACNRKPMVEEELLGKYELVSPRFSGSLELKADHTFIQEFGGTGMETRTAQGKWDYRPPERGSINRGTLGIYGAILESDGKMVQKESDFVISMPVSANWKSVSLWLNADGDHAYVKMNPRANQ